MSARQYAAGPNEGPPSTPLSPGGAQRPPVDGATTRGPGTPLPTGGSVLHTSPVSPTLASRQSVIPPPPQRPSPASSSTPPPPPPPPKSRRRPVRTFFLTTFSVAALYGIGIFASLKSDRFHDFFTEFVPGGHLSVTYVQEKEFQYRFPEASETWTGRVSNLNTSGPHISAIGKDKQKPPEIHDKPPTKIELVPTPTKETPKKAAMSEKPTTPPAQRKTVEPSKAKGELKLIQEPSRKESPQKSKEANQLRESSLTKTLANYVPIEEMTGDGKSYTARLRDRFNSLIRRSNESRIVDEQIAPLFEFTKTELAALEQQVEEIASSKAQEVERKLADQATRFSELSTQQQTAFREELSQLEAKWQTEFTNEREKLENAYKQNIDTRTGQSR